MRPSLYSLLGVTLVTGVCWSQQLPDVKTPAPKSPFLGAQEFTAPEGMEAPRTTRIWGSAEYLLWWVKGQNLPPLVTTSPNGTPDTQAGVLGLPGTSILHGNSASNRDPASGGRFTIGYWLDDDRITGIGGSFFFLCRQCDHFGAGSPGNPILSRPFFDVTLPGQAAQLVAFPGVTAGGIEISNCTELLGADVFLRRNLWSAEARTGDHRLDGLVGYRFLQLRDSLGIRESLTLTDSVMAGTMFDIVEQFRTSNRFHGGDIGLMYQFVRGRLSVDVLGRIAFGYTERVTTIDGSTNITLPGGPSANYSGGLLALDTNIGRFSDRSFSVVPELRVNVGYQITERLRGFIGYNFLYWTHVARAGEQVDLNVNPNFVPPPVVGEPRNPAVLSRDSGFWAQGFNFGVSFNY